MKLWFVNIECRVKKETRTISAEKCAQNPYRTFSFVVVAESEDDALGACPEYSSEFWHEEKRYVQSGGVAAGEAIFNGFSDHDRKRYPAECPEAA